MEGGRDEVPVSCALEAAQEWGSCTKPGCREGRQVLHPELHLCDHAPPPSAPLMEWHSWGRESAVQRITGQKD